MFDKSRRGMPIEVPSGLCRVSFVENVEAETPYPQR